MTPAAPPVRHLYIHVPFCRAKCDYCDFFSAPVTGSAALDEAAAVRAGEALPAVARPTPVADDPELDRFVEAVFAEFELERGVLGLRRLRTVYLGGGTPSLLGVERLEGLLARLEPHLAPHTEVTLETNPEDVSEIYAAWAARRGLRVSLGVQSFATRLRAALGRRATADPAAAFERLRAAGCSNLGIDLIFGIPGQTRGDLGQELAEVARLRPDHVSWYELDVARGTPLARRLAVERRAARRRPGDDPRERSGRISDGGGASQPEEAAELFRGVVRGLGRLGYNWYEVSNFARPGRRCRHNLAVWRGEPYVGLGPAAVSTIGDRRRQNRPGSADYLDALAPAASAARGGVAAHAAEDERSTARPAAPPRRTERLDGLARARERVFLAARIGAPVRLADVAECLDTDAIHPLAEAGFVALRGGTLRVTRKGRYVANEVCVRLFRDSHVKGTV